jgi:hypothetical protein
VADTRPSSELAHGAIGLREVLFQSITHMAPAAPVAFSTIAGLAAGAEWVAGGGRAASAAIKPRHQAGPSLPAQPGGMRLDRAGPWQDPS